MDPARPVELGPIIQTEAVEAEKALLGAILIAPENLDFVDELFPPDTLDWLLQPEHRIIVELVIQLRSAGTAIDLVTLRDKAIARGILDDLGGVEYLVDLVESTPNWGNARHYAELVHKYWRIRQIASTAAIMLRQAAEKRLDPQEALDEIEMTVFGAVKRSRTDATPGAAAQTTIGQALGEAFRLIEARQSAADVGDVATGFRELDDLTGGLHAGDMVVLAGRPSQGKSALAAQIAMNAALDRRQPTLLFSLEMSAASITTRMLCVAAEVNGQRIRSGMLGTAEMERLRGVAADWQDCPLHIDAAPRLTLGRLSSRIRQGVAQLGLRLAIVDYLQLMILGRRCENRQVEVSELSKGIKAIAGELGLPIIVVAQLARKSEERNKPRMSDLRESGAIEQDADVVMLIHREEYYRRENCPPDLRGVAELIVDKQRNGPTGIVKLTWQAEYTRFRDHAKAGDTAGYEPWRRSPEPDPLKEQPAEDQGYIPF